MAGFTESVEDVAFRRAGARCQCKRAGHGRASHAPKTLSMSSANLPNLTAKVRGATDALSGCEVLCQPCHEQTASYARHP